MFTVNRSLLLIDQMMSLVILYFIDVHSMSSMTELTHIAKQPGLYTVASQSEYIK